MKIKFARMAAVSVILVVVALLTGCWDKVNLEDRGFVIGLGIDKSESSEANSIDDGENFTLTLALPVYDGSSEDKIEKAKLLKTADGGTVSGAMRAVEAKSNQKLFLGQTRLLTFGKGLLSDRELFRQAIDAIERSEDISKRTYVMAAEDSAADIIGADSKDEPMAGFFVPEFYTKQSGAVGVTFKKDLAGVVSDLRVTGNTLIPEIGAKGEVGEKEFEFGGSAVIKDFALAGFLSGGQTRGFQWLKGDCRGEEVAVELDGAKVPMRVDASRASLRFSDGGRLGCLAEVSVRGTVSEMKFGGDNALGGGKKSMLEDKYAEAISKEILGTVGILRDEMGVDAYQFLELMRKNEREMYKKYADDWDEAFRGMAIEAKVSVTLVGSGAIE